MREALYLLKQAVAGLSRLRVIVLDLSEVDLIDAGGLAVLTFLHNWTSVKGIELKLVNPSRQVRQMLELTGLTSVFHISSVGDVIEMFCCPDRANENMNLDFGVLPYQFTAFSEKAPHIRKIFCTRLESSQVIVGTNSYTP